MVQVAKCIETVLLLGVAAAMVTPQRREDIGIDAGNYRPVDIQVGARPV